ncbi:MAG: LysE family transporter [Bacillota bacterium]|nr:LysE family transporter [Bacillota bacterium]
MYNFIPFITYALVVTFTPGPNNIMSMINATKYSYRKTFPFMFGVFTGFFFLMLISSYFNLFLFEYIPKIEPFMKIIGGLYMLYLAISIIKSNNKNHNIIAKTNTFTTGIILQLLNVKAILYSLTVMSSFIIPQFKSKLLLILFSLFLSLLAFISLNCWALFGSFFNKLIKKHEKTFNIIMASLLIYSALLISGLL